MTYIGLLIWLIAGCVDIPGQATNNERALEQRMDFTRQNIQIQDWLRCPSGEKVQREAIHAARAATPQSLQHPQLLSALYFIGPNAPGQMRDKILLMITWLEAAPSLREVEVINPTTHKRIKLQISPEDLDQAARANTGSVVLCVPKFIPIRALDAGTDQDLIVRVDSPPQEKTYYPYVVAKSIPYYKASRTIVFNATADLED